MRKTNLGSLSVLQFDGLNKFSQVKHLVSTKEGWKTGDKPRLTDGSNPTAVSYRKELAKSMDIAPEQLFIPKQTHTNEVVVVKKETSTDDLQGKDALVTNQTGLCLVVQTADCVPVLVYDPEHKAVAAIHAGWRGTVSKIVEKAVETMAAEYGSNPENLVACIGPSINKHAYEVGSDVIDEVIAKFSNYKSLLQPSMKSGKAYFDLWEANRTLLLGKGIKTENIELMAMCSYELSDLFFSARRDGADTGRIISAIMLQ